MRDAFNLPPGVSLNDEHINPKDEKQPHMTITLTTTHDIDINRIRGLLCSALEGGSNYWYQIECYGFTKDLSVADFKQGGKMQDPANYWHPSELIPTVEGCAVWVIAPDAGEPYETPHRLDLQALQRGLEVMAAKYPRHWANFMDENDDAGTGDVYLQCCLYGEVVFG